MRQLKDITAAEKIKAFDELYDVAKENFVANCRANDGYDEHYDIETLLDKTLGVTSEDYRKSESELPSWVFEGIEIS